MFYAAERNDVAGARFLDLATLETMEPEYLQHTFLAFLAGCVDDRHP